jgi:hypothetical protein
MAADRWSLEDNTSQCKGYCSILLEKMGVAIDVFPFRKGSDKNAVINNARAIIEVLNAAEDWEAECVQSERTAMPTPLTVSSWTPTDRLKAAVAVLKAQTPNDK